jgi:hypothetical protein
VDPGGLFNHYLKVDSLKAGGPYDNIPGQDRIDWIPAANVTSRASGLEEWVEPVYYLDASDPATPQDCVIGILARGNRNPRKPAAEPDWGDVVFLGSHLFFYRTEDATWFLRTVLSEVFGENP